MIEYLEPEEFKKKYPISDKIGSGRQGDVYKSREYAVKIFKDLFNKFINELATYMTLNHPCIMQPTSWTFDKVGYIAMPLGSNIKEAYEHKLISAQEIISDTFSAIQYMHSIGLSHYDIREDNIIYYKGRAIIIDMAQTIHHTQGDSEYESHSLLISYYTITTGDKSNKGFILKSGIEDLDSFMQKIQSSGIIPKMDDLPTELIVRTHKGILSAPLLLKDYEIKSDILKLGKQFSLQDRAICLANELYLKCVSDKYIPLLGRACINVSSILSGGYYLDIPEIITPNDFYQIIVDIMRICECKKVIV